jgi:hypothetical protein
MGAQLGDSDPVDRRVELPVATAVEPMAGLAARPDRDGATPVCMANRALRPNRRAPPVWPTSFAAVSPPTPTMQRSCSERGWTCLVMSRSSWLIRPVSCRIRSTSSTAICARTSGSPASPSSTPSRSSVGGGGASSGSRAWTCQRSRLIMRLRSATRSSRWSSHSRTASASPASRAAGRSGSRSAALATASASIGSDLPRVRAELLALAINFGGTHPTVSPAVSRAATNLPATCRPSSTAQRRSAPTAAPSQATAETVQPRCTVSCPTCRPVASTATTVWLCWCGSTPSTTWSCLLSVGDTRAGRRTHLSPGAVPRSYQVTPAGPTMTAVDHSLQPTHMVARSL